MGAPYPFPPVTDSVSAIADFVKGTEGQVTEHVNCSSNSVKRLSEFVIVLSKYVTVR